MVVKVGYPNTSVFLSRFFNFFKILGLFLVTFNQLSCLFISKSKNILVAHYIILRIKSISLSQNTYLDHDSKHQQLTIAKEKFKKK